MKASKKTSEQIEDKLRAFLKTYAEQADEPAVRAFFSPDSDFSIIGTDERDFHVGPDGLSAQVNNDWRGLGSARSNRCELVECQVSERGDVAWAVGRVLRHAPDDAGLWEERLSVVFEQRGGDWLIAHWHKSRPVDSCFLTE